VIERVGVSHVSIRESDDPSEDSTGSVRGQPNYELTNQIFPGFRHIVFFKSIKFGKKIVRELRNSQEIRTSLFAWYHILREQLYYLITVL
jgi:hypothetical protein